MIVDVSFAERFFQVLRSKSHLLALYRSFCREGVQSDEDEMESD